MRPIKIVVLLILLSVSTGAAEPAWRVSTDRVRYSPGQLVKISVESPGESTITISHHGRVLVSKPVTGEFVWNPPKDDFTGYLVTIESDSIVRAAAAIDVSSDWARYPRYAAVSNFGEDVDPQHVIDALAVHHVNAIQFYDWAWKHHQPAPPKDAADWPDIANRRISAKTLKGLIDAAHARGMLAFSYGLYGGAYADCYTDGSGVDAMWGAFKKKPPPIDLESQDSHPLPAGWATPRLRIFDPSNPEWQKYIAAKQLDAIRRFDFDGWHVDSIGYRGEIWNSFGDGVDLARSFPGFLAAMKQSMAGTRLIFNTVDLYGNDEILGAKSPVNVWYAELWGDRYDEYAELEKLATQIRRKSGDEKGIVFAAYMQKKFSEGNPGKKLNTPSILLTDAAMYASGASHLELVDAADILTSEYFPARNVLPSDELRASLRNCYTFVTAYQELLRGHGILPLDAKIDLDSAWPISRRCADGTRVFHLINLRDPATKKWRDDDANLPAPRELGESRIRITLNDPPGNEAKLRFASPDLDFGAPRELPFTTEKSGEKTVVTTTVPGLRYWDMLWLEP